MKESSPAKRIILAVAIAINAFIIINASINGTISAQESGRFSHFFAGVVNFFSPGYVTDANFDQFASVIRKLAGHFALFGLNGIFTSLSFYLFLKDTKFGKVLYVGIFSLATGLVVAIVSEIIQIFTPDRYGTWGDIGIDFAGYFLGFVAVICVLLFAGMIKFKNDENIQDLQ